jgi:hypothetical protein
MIRRIFALWFVILATWMAGGSPAAAGGPGSIAGQLAQGTVDGGSIEGVPVTLLVFRGEQEVERRSATAGPDGAFRFEGLESGPGYTYQLVAPYGNVEYGGDPIALSPTKRKEPNWGSKRQKLTQVSASVVDGRLTEPASQTGAVRGAHAEQPE